MKPKQAALFDFRLQITADIDIVLTAKARVLGLDKAAVAREVLTRWALEETAFSDSLVAERESKEAREIETHRKRRPITRRMSNLVYARDGLKCRECGAGPGVENLCVDHIIPVAVGGTNDLSNLRVLCIPCNARKSDKIVSLRKTP